MCYQNKYIQTISQTVYRYTWHWFMLQRPNILEQGIHAATIEILYKERPTKPKGNITHSLNDVPMALKLGFVDYEYSLNTITAKLMLIKLIPTNLP